jgi:hypothetical protein
MSNWLDKFTKNLPKAGPVKRNLPAARPQARPPAQYKPTAPRPPDAKIPNAALIYGGAAGAMFAVALVFLFKAHFLTAFLVCLPGLGLLGFSLHFIKHPDA